MLAPIALGGALLAQGDLCDSDDRMRRSTLWSLRTDAGELQDLVPGQVVSLLSEDGFALCYDDSPPPASSPGFKPLLVAEPPSEAQTSLSLAWFRLESPEPGVFTFVSTEDDRELRHRFGLVVLDPAPTGDDSLWQIQDSGSCTVGGGSPWRLLRPVNVPDTRLAHTALWMPSTVVGKGQDPFLVKKDGYHWYIFSENGDSEVAVYRTRVPHAYHAGHRRTVWKPTGSTPKSCTAELWAPELHYLDGRWWIFVAADDGQNDNHRMWLLKGSEADALEAFELVGPISTQLDRWAIDGTVIEWQGSRYFAWSGWIGEVNEAQHIFIARMGAAGEILGDRVCIATPTYPWETFGVDPVKGLPTVNEGPQAIYGPHGELWLLFSAAGSWTDNYCLGLLKLVGKDLLDPSSWLKLEKPVFQATDEVFAPGHACTFTDAKGQSWLVYHSARHRGSGWDRVVRMQAFMWSEDGTPNFGEPVPGRRVLAAPSA